MSKVEYFIGGGADKSDFLSKIVGSSGIMNNVMTWRRQNTSIKCLYRGHEDEKAILQEIRSEYKKGAYTSIRLTGHSWGGQAVMDIAQELFHKEIPLDELITLDPVSTFGFAKVYAKRWVNVHNKQSFIDKTVGSIPAVGNVLSGIITLPTLVTKNGRNGDYIANLGGQLGAENGAHNVVLNVAHADALKMYKKAREEMKNAPLNPTANGLK